MSISTKTHSPVKKQLAAEAEPKPPAMTDEEIERWLNANHGTSSIERLTALIDPLTKEGRFWEAMELVHRVVIKAQELARKAKERTAELREQTRQIEEETRRIKDQIKRIKTAGLHKASVMLH
jgi:hypothetical protein